MKDIYIFSAVYIGGGLFSLALGLREYLRWRSLVRHGTKTRGIAHALTDDDNGVSLTAIFTGEDGKKWKIFSKGGDSSWTALDGKEIDILYMRGRPKETRMVVDLKTLEDAAPIRISLTSVPTLQYG